MIHGGPQTRFVPCRRRTIRIMVSFSGRAALTLTPTPLMLKDAVDRWTVTDASELYDVPRWGKGYFSVSSQGHMQVHPTKDPNLAIDMKDLIDRLQLRGLDLPILLRFNGI